MTALILALTAVAGGLGAVLRFVIDGVVRDHWRRGHPPGTMIINLSGSLLLGLLAGLVSAGAPPALRTVLQSVLGTGLCGGYTTFSTACIEVVRLLQQRSFGSALWQAFGTLVLSVLLALAGLVVGSLIGS